MLFSGVASDGNRSMEQLTMVAATTLAMATPPMMYPHLFIKSCAAFRMLWLGITFLLFKEMVTNSMSRIMKTYPARNWKGTLGKMNLKMMPSGKVRMVIHMAAVPDARFHRCLDRGRLNTLECIGMPGRVLQGVELQRRGR